MPWIRIDTGMKRDPRIWVMAEDVKKDVAAVVGYVANVLSELPEHAREGDLSAVPDALVEEWALWTGRKGVFAAAFFAHLCDGRQVRAWEKHNGSALRAMDDTRRRVRAYRERNANGNADGNALRNASRTTSTERNGTERNVQTRSTDSVAAAPDDREFAAFWAQYPPRAGGNPRQTALSAWRARRAEGVPATALLDGLARYRAYLEADGKIGTQFVQQAATFLSKAKRSWEDPWSLPTSDVENDPAAAARAAIAQQEADQLWLAERKRLAGVQ